MKYYKTFSVNGVTVPYILDNSPARHTGRLEMKVPKGTDMTKWYECVDIVYVESEFELERELPAANAIRRAMIIQQDTNGVNVSTALDTIRHDIALSPLDRERRVHDYIEEQSNCTVSDVERGTKIHDTIEAEIKTLRKDMSISELERTERIKNLQMQAYKDTDAYLIREETARHIASMREGFARWQQAKYEHEMEVIRQREIELADKADKPCYSKAELEEIQTQIDWDAVRTENQYRAARTQTNYAIQHSSEPQLNLGGLNLPQYSTEGSLRGLGTGTMTMDGSWPESVWETVVNPKEGSVQIEGSLSGVGLSRERIRKAYGVTEEGLQLTLGAKEHLGKLCIVGCGPDSTTLREAIMKSILKGEDVSISVGSEMSAPSLRPDNRQGFRPSRNRKEKRKTNRFHK